MSALRKILVVEKDVAVYEGCERVLPAKPYVAFRAEPARATAERVAEAPAVATALPATAESHLKQVALFAVAPFIALAYAALFPIVGLGFLVVMAIKALAAKPLAKPALMFVRNVALFFAAPFVGLLFIVALPLVGATMFGWIGAKALATRIPG